MWQWHVAELRQPATKVKWKAATTTSRVRANEFQNIFTALPDNASPRKEGHIPNTHTHQYTHIHTRVVEAPRQIQRSALIFAFSPFTRIWFALKTQLKVATATLTFIWLFCLFFALTLSLFLHLSLSFEPIVAYKTVYLVKSTLQAFTWVWYCFDRVNFDTFISIRYLTKYPSVTFVFILYLYTCKLLSSCL